MARTIKSRWMGRFKWVGLFGEVALQVSLGRQEFRDCVVNKGRGIGKIACGVFERQWIA